MTNEMVKVPEQQGAIEVRTQVNQIQYLMKEVLSENEHFGKIPGCGNKPSLFQSGAEKIAFMFHLVPTYEIKRIDLPRDHREYETKCILTNRDTGQIMGEGFGTCSTMESKYRYRNVWNPQTQKKDIRKENLDIADTYNTVLKISKKRAFVDAVKSTTAASDIFTQDIEDIAIVETVEAPKAQENPRRELWNEAASLKEKLLALGANEAGITSWMNTYVVNGSGSPKPKNEYTADDIKKLIGYLQGLISDFEQLKSEQLVEYEYVDDFSNEDISF